MGFPPLTLKQYPWIDHYFFVDKCLLENQLSVMVVFVEDIHIFFTSFHIFSHLFTNIFIKDIMVIRGITAEVMKIEENWMEACDICSHVLNISCEHARIH
jgi:hypothetical protein